MRSKHTRSAGAMEGDNVKLVYSLPEKLQGAWAEVCVRSTVQGGASMRRCRPPAHPPNQAGKKAKEGQPVSHEEGERRWKEEEWEGAGHDPREVEGEDDSGVTGVASPRCAACEAAGRQPERMLACTACATC